MHTPKKNLFLKATAVMVCLAILSLTLPGMLHAKKVTPQDLKPLFKKPVLLFSSLFPFINSAFIYGSKTTSFKNKSNSGEIIKITGTLSSDKVSDGD